ncbi:MAG: ribonuclease III [bacterium]|nr:ribonuclease III [bacterium]
MKPAPLDRKKAEALIGHTFHQPDLLTTAFLHRSYGNEHLDFERLSNERLEFLGDSVLSVVVAHALYQQFPEKPEGELTLLRSAMVSQHTLADVGKELGLGKFLLLAHGEESGGGRENPSILSNTYEAIVAALFLDGGVEPAKRFILKTLLPRLIDIVANGSVRDDKSELQERVQQKERKAPTYKVLSAIGPDHARIFTVGVYVSGKCLGKGTGKNKQAAQQAAALAALQMVDK